MKTLLTLAWLLLPLPLWAQVTVSGRVLDARTHKPLAGAAVSVKGTTLGASTYSDGSFTLTIPPADSVSFHVYCLGCYRYPRLSIARTVRRRVSDTLTIYLTSQIDPNPGCCPTPEPYLTVGARSGVLHTPFGLSLQLPTWHRTVSPAAWLSAAFQTDARGTAWGTATWLIGRHPFWYTRPLRLGAQYQLLRRPGGTARRFDSGAVVGLWRGEWELPWPTLRATAGYARRSSFETQYSGLGGGLGLSGSLKKLSYAGQATYWPGGWQWQARLSRPVGKLECAVEYLRLPGFEEVTLGLALPLY
ncbi:carboxypeptidase-like regulatory domain-containing protein [Hymenobacter gummosus]|uniref:Carboxypeptidase-like regulatory domain-containing protein n=1 Tax=Hymenobacter gummosus TaxID=1776032 RepID=A0A3S0J585_9BACT|nr:carboxypeptidase-like regulatory domain-containing protein [Hymenobacter gummosus]RTQ44725.1 carboxypeptidase-like regulatory domain-containing protein [Hymenobacter gummosus]